MIEIINYSYSINGDILEIFITDLNGNEFILATINETKNLTEEADNIAQETIENSGYILQ